MSSKRILYLGLNPTHYPAKGELTHWPIIQTIPRPLSNPTVYQALSHFEQYSHVIVSSKTTVAILKNYLFQLGIDRQIWMKKATLAIGQVTAKHLQDCGITPIKVAQEETAEGIICELKKLSLEDAHIFWPHSAQARSLIKTFLIDRGITHTTCMIYDTETFFPKTLPNLENFDEIIFTSPSTVKAFLQIFGTFPMHTQLTTIGPITAQFLRTAQNLINYEGK